MPSYTTVKSSPGSGGRTVTPLRQPETVTNQPADYLTELLQRQCGVLTSRQALQAGLTGDMVTGRLRNDRWQRLYRGVYATFSGPPPRESLLWAAVLKAGPRAMLSYHTAAELDRLADTPGEVLHVTIPADRRVTRVPGLAIHISDRAAQALHPALLPPRTRIEETVLDLAGAANTIDGAIGWVAGSLGRRLTTQDRLRQAPQQRPKIRWRAELEEILGLGAAGIHSSLEWRYHRNVELRHGFPAQHRQVRTRRYGRTEYRDVLYEDYQLIVELDGRVAHPSDQRWRDIRRDNYAVAAGLATMRFGWSDVTSTACRTAAEVGLVLINRGCTTIHPCSPTCLLHAALLSIA